ncbi:hypothetical protein RGCCGE502_21485 [Rhizobium grahamii CCGE 502]|uniref:Uncharacterized protein n=1 Tax=Rhizobium grahamii CCGE 502 TaxID=990285 RepID=S3IAA1_9HYPH|nr:hypothetical protein RGCCGE502_21485 [Rhizobium grahamii CCGE 502]
MKKQAVIYNGLEVGIAVPVDDRMKFIAVKFNVIDLDNGIFNSVGDIRLAIAEHIASEAGKSVDVTASDGCPVAVTAGPRRMQHCIG